MVDLTERSGEAVLRPDGKTARRWLRIPIIESLDVRTMWEHTPLDHYRYGEYPRFLRPVDAHAPPWEWRCEAVCADPPA